MAVGRLKNLWMNAIIKNKLPDLLKLYASNANFKGTLMVDPVQNKKEIKIILKISLLLLMISNGCRMR